MNEGIRALAEALKASRRAVFFGGAGVSTESGIPDFRGQDGLYKQKWRYPPEEIISRSFFLKYPEEFYRFYREKMLCPAARPNAAHYALARLEKISKLTGVITQNIDGLHQKAGSVNVLELHGSVLRNYCMRCGKFYDLAWLMRTEGVPKCSCGGIVKPDVVLYEESLDMDVLDKSVDLIARADLMIVAGTSLTVYPAAGLAANYKGRLVLINRDPTPMDRRADILINASVGETLRAVMEEMGELNWMPESDKNMSGV